MSAISSVAKFIRDVTTIVGAFAGISAFFVNVFPETQVGIWLSAKWGELYNSPSGAIGYVYYEVGPNGSETEDGQLVAIPGQTRPSVSDISVGQSFQAVSTVRLRSADTASNLDNVIDNIRGGQCIVLLNVTRELSEEELTEAKEAAWFEVAATRCPSDKV